MQPSGRRGRPVKARWRGLKSAAMAQRERERERVPLLTERPPSFFYLALPFLRSTIPSTISPSPLPSVLLRVKASSHCELPAPFSCAPPILEAIGRARAAGHRPTPLIGRTAEGAPTVALSEDKASSAIRSSLGYSLRPSLPVAQGCHKGRFSDPPSRGRERRERRETEGERERGTRL